MSETSGRFAALSLAAAFAAGAVLALDNTVNNDFWDTRNYVNPTPNEAASDGEVAAVRRWRASNMAPIVVQTR